MLSDVLRYISDRGGAPLTDVRKQFGLPGEMAANLCIQLQDAGYLADKILEPCHHLEGSETGCTSCSGGTCANDKTHPDDLVGFNQGCCGMNAPYELTATGRVYLALFPITTPEPLQDPASAPTAEEIAAAWVKRYKARRSP